jgi:hypothetical protein
VSKGKGFPHETVVVVDGKKYHVLIWRVTPQKTKTIPEPDKDHIKKTLCWGLHVSLVEKDDAEPFQAKPIPISNVTVEVKFEEPEDPIEPEEPEEDDLTDELINAFTETPYKPDLSKLKYRKLQEIAKEHDIKANQSKDDLIDALEKVL